MSSKSFEKLIEEIGNMKVMELSEFVTEFKKKFNVPDVSFGAGAAPAAAAAAAPKEEAKSEYKITLVDSGANKINVIKALRKVVPSLGIGDAKAAVDNTPYVVGESVPKADALNMKKELEAAGAKVEMA